MNVDPNAYLETIKKLEPDISMIDAGAFYASAAISLKRIADSLDRSMEPTLKTDVAAIINAALRSQPGNHMGYAVIEALLKAGVKIHW